MDAGSRRVDGQFADGDLDAADALISDAQNSFGVGSYQQIHLVRAQTGVPEGGFDILGMIDTQVDATGAAEFLAEPLDRQPDGRGVDHREHFGNVFSEQAVEQHLVAIPQVGEIHPLPQIV